MHERDDSQIRLPGSTASGSGNIGPMIQESDQAHAEDLLRRVDEQVHRDDAADRSVDILVERYQLPADRAFEFPEEQAQEDDRDPVDVAVTTRPADVDEP